MSLDHATLLATPAPAEPATAEPVTPAHSSATATSVTHADLYHTIVSPSLYTCTGPEPILEVVPKPTLPGTRDTQHHILHPYYNQMYISVTLKLWMYLHLILCT